MHVLCEHTFSIQKEEIPHPHLKKPHGFLMVTHQHTLGKIKFSLNFLQPSY